MLAVAAVLFLLGGLVQINPIWQWGPYQTGLSTNAAQPDWYLGWLIGALRLMPGFDVVIGGRTVVPNPFWGGLLFPLVVLLSSPGHGSSGGSPATAAGTTCSTDRATRPCARPFGAAFLAWVMLVFFAGLARPLDGLLRARLRLAQSGCSAAWSGSGRSWSSSSPAACAGRCGRDRGG